MKFFLKIVLIVFVLLHNFSVLGSGKKDSLLVSLANKTMHDTSRVNSYLSLAVIYLNDGNPDSSLIFGRKAMSFSEKIDYKKGVGMAFNFFGRYYNENADYKKAIQNCEQAIKIFKELGLKLKEAKAILSMAPNYSMLGNIKKSLDFNLQALKILESINDDTEMARAYSNIGNLYEKLEDSHQAIKYFEKCIVLSKNSNNKKQIGTALYNLSRSLSSLHKYAEADSKSKEAYEIFKELNYKIGLSYVVQSCALIATNMNQFDKAEKYYNEGIILAEENGDKNILAYSYSGLADVLMKQKKYSGVIEKLNRALLIANEIENLELLVSLHNEFSEAYFALGDYKKSIDNHIIYSRLKDSLFQANSSQQIAEMQTKYDSEKKDQENQLLTTQNNLSGETIKRQKTTGYFIATGLVLTLISLFFILKGLQNQKKANKIIEFQQQETDKQKHIVEEKNKEITDSIIYASRIQKAMLTSENFVKRYFDNFFILFKPKDIVSGDFYWAYHENGKTFFVTADCTGHGVPGAMMSMLSINLLNEIICERKVVGPDRILNLMRKEIIKALNSEDSIEEANDGLDCSLLIFDHTTLKLQYSCANNGFYVIRNGTLLECKADKMPIGKSPRENDSFTFNELQLQLNDLVFTFTDGYADQFGGPKGKKFKYKQLEDLLLSDVNLPLNDIKEKLNSTIDLWKGNLEQVDDICIIGIRV